MKIQFYHEAPEHSYRQIHLANGTYDVFSRTFSEEKDFSLNRLPVAYDPKATDVSDRKWFNYLIYSLLDEEDVLTLQEYLGYCLLPSTKAQKMLLIIGKGGEGKSVLGRVIQLLFGNQMYAGSLQKIATDRFARADLEHKLIMVDDDMRLDALPQTNYLKTLVTLEGTTDLERKGQQSYQGRLFARFLCFSNGTLSALYDRSHGFYRRQIILTTLDREPDRVDNPYLAELIMDELPAIFNWCLEGLFRLLDNDYRFTISERARKNLEEAMREANNIPGFLESEGYIHYTPKGCASTAELCRLYRSYCEDNSLHPQSDRSLQHYLKNHQKELGIDFTFHLPTIKHKSVRGYVGIQPDGAILH